MKRKFFKFFRIILNIFLFLMLLLCVGTVGMAVASYFVEGIDFVGFIYLLFGDVLTPIEILVNGGLGGFALNQFKIVTICASAVLAVFIIICMATFSKIGKKNKKHNFIKTLILSFLLTAYTTFSAVVVYFQFKPMSRFFGKTVKGIPEMVLDYTTKDLIQIKGFALFGIIAVFSLFVFVFNIFCKEKTKEQKVKEIGLSFYSDRYLRKEENANKVVQQEETKITTDKSKPKGLKKKKQEELISKIIQLNKLKDGGEITDVEYTKLRQRLIRRYKG